MAELLEIIAIASGVPLVILGLLLLLIRPARRPAVFFGLFSILWGLQVTASNTTRILQDASAGETALLVSFALVPPTFLYLGRFVALFLPPKHRRITTVTAMVLCLVALAQLFLATHTILADVAVTPQGTSPTLGWAVVPLFVLPFHGLLYIGIGALYWRAQRASSEMDHARHRGLLAALALFASHMSVTNFFVFLNPPPFVEVLGQFVQTSLVIGYGLGAIFLVAIAAQAARAPNGKPDYWLICALLVPGMFALGESLIRSQAIYVDTVGLWRLLSVAIIVYTLAKYQLFDIELKLRWTVRQGTVASVFAVAFFAASEYLEQYVPVPGPMLGILAAGVITLALRPVQEMAERFAERLLPGVEAPEHLAARRVEVYRAALEGILWDGYVSSQERSVLNRLQKKLGIDPVEAKSMQDEVLQNLATA